MHIKNLKVEIRPECTFSGGRTVYECRISVEMWGHPLMSCIEHIPDDDFKCRFDWLMDRMKDEVKHKLNITKETPCHTA